MEDVKYRPAEIKDIPELVKLEESCFDYDQLSTKNFKHIIQRANADLCLLEVGGSLAAYAVLFYRKGTSLCRLYSIAVSPSHQGKGLGAKLLAQLEKLAGNRGASYIRLEVKKTNASAIALYEKHGYQAFTTKAGYYDDGTDALCMEKMVQFMDKKGTKLKVPFYQQTTDFTCGPACLLMAMKSLEPKNKLDRGQEIQIWREATTIFMTSGHGGCGPHGLALAAFERGFGVELYLSTDKYLFVEGVRQQDKKDIIKLVQDQFQKELKVKKIPLIHKKLNWKTLEGILAKGGVPLVLISSYRLTNSKVPHWIVITGMSKDFVFFNDPYVEECDTIVSNTSIPVRKDEFEAMAKFGRGQIKSFVAVYKA